MSGPDVVFGLFALLGYQFSPRLADAGEARFWRMDRKADYGPLSGVSLNRVRVGLIRENRDELLRVAGSPKLETVTASEFARTLRTGPRTSAIAAAIAEVGRAAESLSLLSYADDAAHRRRTLVRLNRHEKRHELARKVFHGQRARGDGGTLPGGTGGPARGLVVNAVCLFNSLYFDEAVRRLREEDEQATDEDLARVSRSSGSTCGRSAATASRSTSRWPGEVCARCVTRRSRAATSRSRPGPAKRRRGSPALA